MPFRNMAESEGYRYGDARDGNGKEFHAEQTDLKLAPLDGLSACECELPGTPTPSVNPIVELPNIGGWTRITISDAADKLGHLFSQDGGL